MKIKEMNEKLVNEWQIDTWYYMCHKEWQIEKKIPINEHQYYKFTIAFSKHYFEECYKLKMYVERCTIDGAFATSHGLGKQLNLTENIYKRRNFNELVKASMLYPTEILQQYLNDNKFEFVSGGGLIVEEW